MFIQALAEYADHELIDQLAEEAFEERPVPYLVEIGSDGGFLNITENRRNESRGKKTISVAANLMIPKSPVPRNSGLYPLLAADDVKYVLGAGPWTGKGQEENNRERYVAFAELIQEAATQTQDPSLLACAKFYGKPEQVEAARQALGAAKAGTIVALSVGGPVVKRSAVRDFWRIRYRAAATDRTADSISAECMISGRIGPIAPTHEKIKGLASLGGQPAGVSLMSFDKAAFRSYGWEQNQNSPVSPERALAYTLALNDLLRPGSPHRRDMSGIGFLFWTKRQDPFDFMAAVDYAGPSQVQDLLHFKRSADPDPNKFYMAGVSGNGGRMMLRCWVSETLETVKSNLQGWFEGLQVADVVTGSVGEPPRLWELRRAIHREGEPPADRITALVRRAVEGAAQPLGHRMLFAALSRMRHATGKELQNKSRIGLIRLCLNDIGRSMQRNGDETGGKFVFMAPTLDMGNSDPAYLCGRLLAVYESLQYRANGSRVNSSVVDRYYSLASTLPALAFPKLDALAISHLKKLRRERPGASLKIQEQVDELSKQIAEAGGSRFPSQLSLEGQGRFVLGFHHQRAQFTADKRAYRAKLESTTEKKLRQEQA